MINWFEPAPGFWLPRSTFTDATRWPDYSAPGFVRAMADFPNPEDLLVFPAWVTPSRRGWAAWEKSFANDTWLTWNEELFAPIADRKYETARYKFLVPAWRRAIVDLIGDIDDIEDQVSTILWIMEIISKKVLPIPPTVMNLGQKLQNTLDTAERTVAGITPFRFVKRDYDAQIKALADKKRAAKRRKAGLLAWFQKNWGRILEAAQATGTWFDVGIVLGPIMGWIEEGMWGVAQQTTNNYLIAVDALMPGYKEDFERNAQELSDRIDQAWEDTWGRLDNWTNEQINDRIGFGF